MATTLAYSIENDDIRSANSHWTPIHRLMLPTLADRHSAAIQTLQKVTRYQSAPNIELNPQFVHPLSHGMTITV
ncbi:uncharacterized protein N7473_012736 [Penicillium subrubescens]|uniref:uncharacterized protein n=1 Tax=Penicillium subrubescens TaxID=1316194 RepID=UPI002545337B|nr:uncharacterized protein N7473_012736 [Penicillium subrubescens]KAJ5875389.1 hypothetical protein N7473_012736 [Penicillium subrubescens]